MGWQADEYGIEHEGFPVAVLGDGTEPGPITQRGTGSLGITATVVNSSWWLYDGKEGRPLAIAVRAGCECGWRSRVMFPIDWEDHEATDGYEYNDGPFAAWEREHIASLLGTTVPSELADAIDTVRQMLAGLTQSRPLAATAAAADVERLGTAAVQRAVTAARDTNASWEDVGVALGTSKQAAHQRFAKNLFRG